MEETVALEDDVFGASVEQLLRTSPQEVARQMGVSVSEARRVRRVVLERCAAEAVSCGEILREEVRRETAEGRGVTCPVRSGWQRGNLTIPMRGHVLSLSAKIAYSSIAETLQCNSASLVHFIDASHRANHAIAAVHAAIASVGSLSESANVAFECAARRLEVFKCFTLAKLIKQLTTFRKSAAPMSDLLVVDGLDQLLRCVSWRLLPQTRAPISRMLIEIAMERDCAVVIVKSDGD